MDLTVEPARRLEGTVRVPGDKSVSHRALILAAMAEGESRIRGLAPGADVLSTAACLRRLGVGVRDEGGEIAVAGKGWRVAPEASLDAGNSGTTMRLLGGALAGREGGLYVLSGDASLTRRPMDRIARPLGEMGARIELASGRFPPLIVHGAALRGIAHRSPVASAQVKGAVLLAGLQAEGATRVVEPGPSRDHTERFLAWLGAPVGWGDGEVVLEKAWMPLPPFEVDVPGDLSSAACLLVAACLVPGSEVRVEGVGLNPTRTGVLDVLRAMGADLEIVSREEGPEPAGAVTARSGPLHGVEVGGDLVPRAIDELPLIAVAATRAAGTTVIRDAAELSVKESDRIAVLARGLAALGADVEPRPDGWVVHGDPGRALTGGGVDPEGDHRMALALAVAGLVAGAPVTLAGWECSEVSYPGFTADLERIAVR